MPTEIINPEGGLIEATHLSAEGNRDSANAKGADRRALVAFRSLSRHHPKSALTEAGIWRGAT